MPQPAERGFLPFRPHGFQQATTEEVKVTPVDRRIIYLLSDGEEKRLGKTTMVELWQLPRWWKEAQHSDNPGVIKCEAIQHMHHFVGGYDLEPWCWLISW